MHFDFRLDENKHPHRCTAHSASHRHSKWRYHRYVNSLSQVHTHTQSLAHWRRFYKICFFYFFFLIPFMLPYDFVINSQSPCTDNLHFYLPLLCIVPTNCRYLFDFPLSQEQMEINFAWNSNWNHRTMHWIQCQFYGHIIIVAIDCCFDEWFRSPMCQCD